MVHSLSLLCSFRLQPEDRKKARSLNGSSSLSHNLTDEDQPPPAGHVEILAGSDRDIRTIVVEKDDSLPSVPCSEECVAGTARESDSVRDSGVALTSSGGGGGVMDDGITEEEREMVILCYMHSTDSS